MKHLSATATSFSRVEYLRSCYEPRLNPMGFDWGSVLQSDPSEKKLFLPWVCKQVLSGGVLPGDLASVRTVLAHFSTSKQTLSAQSFSTIVGSYPSWQVLSAAITEAQQITDAQQFNLSPELAVHGRRLEHGKDYSYLHVDAAFSVTQILSSKGAAELCNYSHWPFVKNSAGSDQTFRTPQSVFLIESFGQKYYLRDSGAMESSSTENPFFCSGYSFNLDAARVLRQIPERVLIANPLLHKPVLKHLLPDPSTCSNDYLEAVVGVRPDFLRNVPAFRKTPAMCLRAVNADGESYRWVPNEIRNSELLVRAIASNGAALKLIDPSLRSKALCELALFSPQNQSRYANTRSNPAFEAVPQALRTRDLCARVLEFYGAELSKVPDALLDESLVSIAARNCPSVLSLVDGNLISQSLLVELVSRSGSALFDVPQGLRSPDVCLAAIAQGEGSLRHVPYELRTPELCELAVRTKAEVAWVPEHLMTPDFCDRYVAQHPDLSFAFHEESQPHPELKAAYARAAQSSVVRSRNVSAQSPGMA